MSSRFAAALSLVSMLAVAGAVLTAQDKPAAAGAQAQPTLPPPTNLQVMSKDTSAATIASVMQTMSRSLGVQCAYCHVNEGPGGRNDMASDEKPTKQTARTMIKLVLTINDTLNTALGKSPDGPLRVQCVMCHRGQTKPKAELPPAVAAPAPANQGR